MNDRTAVFDYGCGRGGDLRRLRSCGIECEGWDPVHRPATKPKKADVVNLGYVINVIEDADERASTLRAAWYLADRLLVVSAQLMSDAKSESGLIAHRDGHLTRANTFQKYYQQEELRGWIEKTLGVASIAAAPGVFFVFRDEQMAQSYLLSRIRKRVAAPQIRKSDKLFEAHTALLKPLMDFFATRGRLPEIWEIGGGEEIGAALGSIRRAFSIIRRVTGEEQWTHLRNERAQDLLVYLALAKFGRRALFSALPEEIQLDVRALFSSYRQATHEADQLLFSVGRQDVIDAACRASLIGKQTPKALYLHIDVLPRLPSVLRVYEGCARAYVGSVDGANIIKMHRAKPQISYLSYPDFEQNPHPSLRESLKVRFTKLQIEYRDYRESVNPFILHRKEHFIAAEHPLRAKFERLTRSEEAHDLYSNTSIIGTKEAWEQLLEMKGLVLRGHRLLRRAPAS